MNTIYIKITSMVTVKFHAWNSLKVLLRYKFKSEYNDMNNLQGGY